MGEGEGQASKSEAAGIMSLVGPSFLTGLEGSGCVSLAKGGVSLDLVWFRFGTNAAVLYDLSELRSRAVLSVPSHISLTTGVAYSASLEKHIVVFNSTKVIAFDVGSATTDSVETLLETSCVATLDSTNPAVELVTADDGDGQVYVLLANGELQTVRYCVKHLKTCQSVPGPTKATNIYVKNFNERSHSIHRLQTRVFQRDGRIFASHIFKVLHPRTKVGGAVMVRTFRLGFDSETEFCKQTPIDEIELDKEVTSAVQVGSKIVYIDATGSVLTQDLLNTSKSKANVVSLASACGGAKIGVGKAEFVSRLSDSQVAVIGNKTGGSGEGYAVAVADVRFDGGLVLDAVTVKAVSAEGGSLLNCFGGNRIFVKHGARMATIFAQSLPSSLADFVGQRAFGSHQHESQAKEAKGGLWEAADAPSQPLELYKTLPELVREGGSAIESVLDAYTDIPELIVLNAIEVLVRSPEANRSMLSRAFNVPVSESVLVAHLRNSDFRLVQDMLRHLLALVQIESSETADLNEESFESHLAWISCILNAHYANFLISEDKDSVKILEDALETVQVLEANVNSMGEAMAVVKLIHDKQMIQTDYSNRNYNIEVVDL